jgi:hypothetical protein
VILFLWTEGVPSGQIHQHVCAQYGDNALPRRVTYEWIEMLKNGRTSVTDVEHWVCLTTATATQK